MLKLHTFGGLFLERDGTRLDALSSQRKGLALLAMLAAAGERGVSRETALALLWPDSPEDRARTSLRQLVHALRSQLEEPELLEQSAELRLNPLAIASDIADFRDAIERGSMRDAVEHYTGPFLDGVQLRGADGFERWVETERNKLAHMVMRTLERVAAEAARAGDVHVAVDAWRRLANMEPLSARFTIGLMTALDAAGERAAALQHARVYHTLLRQELDGTPDPVVTELEARLRESVSPDSPKVAVTGGAAVPSSSLVDDTTPPGERATPHAIPSMPVEPPAFALASPSGAPRFTGLRLVVLALAGAVFVAAFALLAIRRRDDVAMNTRQAPGNQAPAATLASVAVMPFVNSSGDPTNDPLSDGLTDELIGALGRMPDLRVVGRTSVFAMKGRGLTVHAVGDTLGVASVVEGSVRRVGDRIKVTAQLVRVTDNVVLWADSYDRTLTDVFAVQEEIARAIVSALEVRLGGPLTSRLVGRTTTDPVAYDLFLRGRHLFSIRPDRDGVRRSREYLEQAVARDTTFARAYAALADVHIRLAVFGFGRPAEEFSLARAAANRALALDSALAEAHTALGHIKCVADYDWRGAERAFRRSVELDPGYTFARIPFGICLMSEGRFAEAVAQLDSAHMADPLDAAPSNVLGRVYVSAHQPDLAIRQLSAALELNPLFDLAYQQLAHAYVQKRMYPEAVAAMRRAAELSGIRDSAQLAYVYAVSGARDDAAQLMRLLVGQPSDRYLPPYHIAMAYAGLGNADSAFLWLDRAYAERASFMGGVKVEPGFATLHSDPRWRVLLVRMGLTGSE